MIIEDDNQQKRQIRERVYSDEISEVEGDNVHGEFDAVLTPTRHNHQQWRPFLALLILLPQSHRRAGRKVEASGGTKIK